MFYVTHEGCQRLSSFNAQKNFFHMTEAMSYFIVALPLALFKVRSGACYSEEQRQFASTLHYYSPAAYLFARKHLPLQHPRMIRGKMTKMTMKLSSGKTSTAAGPDA
jgi:hypothetical protein